MIRIDIKKDKLPDYKKIINWAKNDNVLKGFGNPDNPWIMLKFDTYNDVIEWLKEKDKEWDYMKKKQDIHTEK